MSRKKEKPKITLFELLATNATSDSRKFLKKHGQDDAHGYEDLESKLASYYHEHPDKVQLEKELVDIHPHKDFILKYARPEKSDSEQVKNIVASESQTGCDGSNTTKCSCAKCTSNACGCGVSNFEGDNNTVKHSTFTNNELTVFALISIVAIVGMVVYSDKNIKI